MAMFPISTQTLNADAGVVQFLNIPQTYTHLRIVSLSKGTVNNAGNNLSMYTYFNGSTANLTNRHGIQVNGASPTSNMFNASGSQGTVGTVGDIPSSYPNFFGVTVMDIYDYRNTNKAKIGSYIGGADNNNAGSVVFGQFCWNNTAAITQIDLSTDGSWKQYSTFQLYGIDSSLVGTF